MELALANEACGQITESESSTTVLDEVKELLRHADEAHGVEHALAVSKHAYRAMQTSQSPSASSEDCVAVMLAALLHDADDRKLFPSQTPGEYCNARRIMRNVIPELREKVIRLISYVSCTENGNDSPADLNISRDPLWYYPRLADRLEAIGLVGILRCYQYAQHKGNPLFLPGTLRATTEAELATIATEERFRAYVNGQKSVSFIDHFYDKLLHIADFSEITENPYFLEEARKRRKVMTEFLLDFGNAAEGAETAVIDRWVNSATSSMG